MAQNETREGFGVPLECSLGGAVEMDEQDLVVYGDSVTWGQELLDEQKFTDMVASGLHLHLRMNAHSGATNGVGDTQTLKGCGREAPFSYPTTVQQIQDDSGNPDSAAVVIVDGGINDVSVANILNPFTLEADLRRKIRTHCHDDMIEIIQLLLARYTSEGTTIVVTSYFPIFSPQSDIRLILPYLAGMGIALPPEFSMKSHQEAFANRSVELAMLFWHESTAQLETAVKEINSKRVLFANVPFTEANAMFTHESWLFNVHLDGLKLVPEDPVAHERKLECALCYPHDPFHVSRCELASAGHPNVIGSKMFFQNIEDVLGKGLS